MNATDSLQLHVPFSKLFWRQVKPVTRVGDVVVLRTKSADAGNAYRRASLANAGTQEGQGEDVVETQRSATSTAAPSPKNILSRLYGVLADIPKMVFGSQEDERAMDDVLFEIRREVFEVGRRSRQQE